MRIDLERVLNASNDCINSATRLKGLMRDLYPEEKREINVLLNVYDSGIPIIIMKKGSVDETEYYHYIKKILDDYAMEEDAITEALNEWIDALLGKGYSEGLYKYGIPRKKNYEATGYKILFECLSKSEQANEKLKTDFENYYMGELYYFGLYVDKDWNKAKKYYRRIIKDFFGCEYYWKACARLSTIYEPLDKEEFVKAVEQMNYVVRKHTKGLSEKEISILLGEY